ncbi:hypothetical protein [Methylobacter svalbardensis]|uniref:hypothetical protein n=1 Tax=Methylobacter svalbardensis TaxID=3080016 RepID=UPI0030ED56A9
MNLSLFNEAMGSPRNGKIRIARERNRLCMSRLHECLADGANFAAANNRAKASYNISATLA